jgi:hypothetical protein
LTRRAGEKEHCTLYQERRAADTLFLQRGADVGFVERPGRRARRQTNGKLGGLSRARRVRCARVSQKATGAGETALLNRPLVVVRRFVNFSNSPSSANRANGV